MGSVCRGKAAIVLCLLAASVWAEDRATWIKALKESWFSTSARNEAMERLKAEGPEAFKDVSALLKHSSARVRREAMQILVVYAAKMDNVDLHRAVLIKALADPDQAVAAAAAVALARAGPKTIPKLFSRSRGKDKIVAEWASRALVAAGPRAVPYLQKKLGSNSKGNVLGALSLLERIGLEAAPSEAAVKPLRSAPQTEVRLAAYRTLGAIGANAKETVKLLLAGLDDPDPRIAYAVRAALSRRSKEAAAPLARRIEAPASLVRDKAIFAYQSLSQEATPALEALLESESARTRATVLHLLVWRGVTDKTRARMHQLLASGEPTDRVEAMRCFALQGREDKNTLPALMKDQETRVADWAWYRAWFDRSASLPERTPTAPEVLARVEGARSFATLNRLLRGKDPETEQALRAIDAMGSLAVRYRAGTPDLRASRVANLPAAVRKGCERGWRWLAANQREDGLWSGGLPGTDIGVTAFALLALSGGGHTDAGGPYAATVRKGLLALGQRMDKNGFIGVPGSPQSMLQHILATAAILDAYLVGSYPTGWVVAVRAVKRTLELRHPKGAWAYSPRHQKRDLFHTIWATYALRLGSLANVVRREEFAPEVLALITRLTDPEFGQVGYSVPGGSPARSGNLDLRTGNWSRGVRGGGWDKFPPENSASMTSGAAWVRWLLDDGGRRDKIVHAGLEIISHLPPAWNAEGGRIDLMYWLFAANALALGEPDGRVDIGKWGNERLKSWYPNGVQALLTNQLTSGAWPAEGAWHAQGGDVYTASAALLYLLAPAQFSADFLPSRKLKRPGAYGEIEATLKKAARSKNPRIAFAAYVALRENVRPAR